VTYLFVFARTISLNMWTDLDEILHVVLKKYKKSTEHGKGATGGEGTLHARHFFD